MSERAISDPSQHGWVEVDGKWMWDSSGGGGSIQDGDTEGQITTWDGTEWTPEGAVVVDGGNVGIGTDTPLYTSAGRTALTVNGDTSASIVFGHSEAPAHYLLSDASGLTIGDDSGGNLTIDAAGDVDVVDGELRVSSTTDTTKLSITNSAGTYEIANNEYGSLDISYNGDERFVLASNGDVYLYGKLFINGEEVGAGGGGSSLWTDNGDGSISSTKTAKAPDFVAT